MRDIKVINGEIVFAIADKNEIKVEDGLGVVPTKIVNKGSVIALDQTAPRNIWIYQVGYNDDEFLESLETVVDQLYKKRDYICELVNQYEKVYMTIYMRSDFAQMGCSIPNNILKKIASLGCELSFDILSYGMAFE